MQDRPDDLTLAAYLEGGLDEAGREAVERWLAASPEAVDLLRACREALDTPSFPAPQSLVESAGALVGETGNGAAEPQFWRDAYWPSAAALVLVSCLFGFELAHTAASEAGRDFRLAAEAAVIDLDLTGGSLL